MAEEKKDFVVDLLPDDSGEIITLLDEEDNEVPFYQIACIEHNDDFYAMLQPATEVEGIEEDEVIIVKMLEAKSEDEDLFEPVTDENLLDKLYEAYIKAVEEEQDDDEDDEDDEEDEE